MKRNLGRVLTAGLIVMVSATALVGCGQDEKKKNSGNIYTARDGQIGRTDTTSGGGGGYSGQNCAGNAAPADAMDCAAGRAMIVGNGVQFKNFLSADLPTDDPTKVGTITYAGLWLRITPNNNMHFATLPANQSVSFGSASQAPTNGDTNHIRIVVWDSLVGTPNPAGGGNFQPIQIDLPPSQPTADTLISGTVDAVVGATRLFNLNYRDAYGTVRITGTMTNTAPQVLNITNVSFVNNYNANTSGVPQSGSLGGTTSGFLFPSLL